MKVLRMWGAWGHPDAPKPDADPRGMQGNKDEGMKTTTKDLNPID